MNWSLINILMLFGILQGAVLIGFILNKNDNNTKAKRYLVFVIAGLIMNLLFYMLRDIGLNSKFPIFESLYAPWALLASGSFYLYVVYTSPFDRKEKYFKWTLVPFIAVSAFYLLFRLCLHGILPISINADTTHYVYLIEEYFGIGFCILMGILSYQKINRIEEKIRAEFSNYNESKLKFHRRILLLLFIYVIAWIILYSYSVFSNTHVMGTYYALWLFIAAVIYWMALIGFVRDETLLPSFEQRQIDQEEAQEKAVKLEVHSHAKLNEQLSEQQSESDNGKAFFDSLLLLFREKKTFTDPDLSLKTLADEIGISKSYLSKIINQYAAKNFYQFVNEYRVEHFIKLYKEDLEKLYSISGLAEKAGFKSKSTFHSSFKRITGQTPSGYLKGIEK